MTSALGDLLDQVCPECASEADHKDRCSYHGDQVNGPRVVAFAYKVEVCRTVLVSIYVEAHNSALRLRCEVPTHVSRIPLLEAH